MPTPRLLFAALALAVGLAGLVVLSSAAAATPAEQARIVVLTNQARTASGLPAVTESAALDSSADTYSLAMATLNFFSHTGVDGSTFVQRNEETGYTDWTWMGENIAAGQQSADEVFQAWMNSPGHRANILNPQAREIGLGHAVGLTSTYRHYWTMELAARPGSPAAPTATPTVAPRPVGPPGRFRIELPTTMK